MRAVIATSPGGPEVLTVVDASEPVAREGEVVVRVVAAGVNRADLMQRRGLYPPPPGASDILGLEVSGTIVDVGGSSAGPWAAGDAVCALLAGGGYAEYAAVPTGQLLRCPPGLDLVDAAGIPEVFVTAHDALFTRGRLGAGQTVLIHGGGGGVGTAAVQLVVRAGARAIVTAGGRSKLDMCAALGATHGINYRERDFVADTLDHTGGAGADLILDVMGAAYLRRNLDALATDGRLVIIGLQGGTVGEIDLGAAVMRRQSVITTSLRSRPAEQKAAIVEAVRREVMPGFEDGSLRVVVDRVLELDEAAEAHRMLEAGGVTGKLLLRP